MSNKTKIQLGIAPTNWSSDALLELGQHIPLEQCLDEMAVCGYEGCELGHKFPKTVKAISALVSQRGLRIASHCLPVYLLLAESYGDSLQRFAQDCAKLQQLGAETIVITEYTGCVHNQRQIPLSQRPTLSEDDWDKLVDGLSDLHEIALQYAMQLVYHPRMGTVIQTRAEIDKLMQYTADEQLGLLLDTGQLLFADVEPLNIVQDYADRIRHVHLKDIRRDILVQLHRQNGSFLDAVKAGVFTVPGDGMYDFKPILNALETTGYGSWVVVHAEQDPEQKSPLHYARTAKDYVQALLAH